MIELVDRPFLLAETITGSENVNDGRKQRKDTRE